jgi:hypothetical protein
MTNNKRSASNMAFGRPPICILRIGDFYDTKVVFESLNIEFDPLVWDLNQEGIGVQPMIATISMNFKFIGGSDLTGPIARLQNAITFNFFANTGVYDDRNDRFTSSDSTTKQAAIDTGGMYIPKYDHLYNPGVYDSKTTSDTTTTVGSTPQTVVPQTAILQTVEPAKPVDIAKSVAKASGKDTETESKRSENKNKHIKKTIMYTYQANISPNSNINGTNIKAQTSISVQVINSMGVIIKTENVDTIDFNYAFEAAKIRVNDYNKWEN